MKLSDKQKFRNICGLVGIHRYLNNGYLFLILLGAFVSPYHATYPTILIFFVTLEIMVILYHRFLARYLMQYFSSRVLIIKGLTFGDTNIATVIWGAFTFTTLSLFELSWPGQLAIMITACLIMVSLTLMVPTCSFLRTYVIILLAPVGVWGFLSQSVIGYFFSFLFLLQGACLLYINRQGKDDGLNMPCIDHRTAELVWINKEQECEILYRKNMEKALRRSEERYRTLFQNNPIETIIVDHNARITGYNSAKARSLGRVPVIGDIMYKDYGSRHVNDMFEELMDCIKTGRQKEFPEQKYNQRYLHIRISPYSGGAIITSLDITKTKRAEEQIQILTREILRVQENERKRIARDLHDSVAQDLSSLRISCETFFDDQQESAVSVRGKMKEMSRVLHGAIIAVRDIAYELRPPSLDELGLPITLYRYCEDFSERTGIEVDFFSAGLEQFRMDSDSEINLYRLVQEALNNIRKHSRAQNASIRLVASYPHVILRIDDNGIGFEAELQSAIWVQRKHMGLRSMEERVNLLGGRIRLKSRPGAGTSVFVEVPIFHTIPGEITTSTEKVTHH